MAREVTMEMMTRKDAGVLIVGVKGKMDAITAPEFDKGFNAWTGQEEKSVIFDLTGLEYISSAGLRSMLAAGKKVKAADGRLCIIGLGGPVKEVFKLSGFYSIFDICETETEAIQKMR